LEKSIHEPLALVTGAGKRVGKLIALHLAAQGYAVGVHYHGSETEARETAAQIRGMGHAAYLLQADLSDPQAVQSIFKRMDEIQNPLKVLVNSAAVLAKSDLLKIEVAEWDRMMNLNARAVWLMSREAAQRMLQGGSIINISDVGAGKNWSGYGAYAVSKAAVETITRILAKQLAPKIRMNAIAPGLLLRGEDVTEEQWQALSQKVPMGKAGGIDQFLQTLDFLLSNEYITGEIITLAGGYQLV
jgi:pteridine reductase